MTIPLQFAAKLACRDIYSPITPDVFDKIFQQGETVCGMKVEGDFCYLANQGTENEAGWLADFLIEPTHHPVLGDLHGGFYKNLPALVAQLLSTIPLGAAVITCGHSKGAAEACILAALLKLAGINVVQVYAFACPNAGKKELANWLQMNIRGLSYRNVLCSTIRFGDPVPVLPIYPYVAPYPHTIVTKIPPGCRCVFPVEWHSAELYFEAVSAPITLGS